MLTERQIKRIDHIIQEAVINEFMQPSFDWNVFNSLLDNDGVDDALEYCDEHLGEPIGEGTDRVVYEIDDHTVLKICNSNNVEQNEREWNVYQECKNNPLLPRIYGHAADFSWLWSERVLPCTPVDFEKILGIPYRITASPKEWRRQKNTASKYQEYETADTGLTTTVNDDWGDIQKLSFEGFLEWYESHQEGTDGNYPRQCVQAYKSWLQHPWFKNLMELCNYQRSTEFFDSNLGLAMRNGKPSIVVLDIGWID